MDVLPLETAIVYGPIYSRRLGRSLGINLLPPGRKICSFDCIYCHYGHTPPAGKTLTPERTQLPTLVEVVEAVERALRHSRPFDCLTFSGNGEPTLHPGFRAIVAEVRRLRDRFKPEAQLVLLSNASTLHLESVREALALFDKPILKLDAGDPATFAAINRPLPEIVLERIIARLKDVPNLIVQAVLIEGPCTNARGAAYEAWLEALAEVRPLEVQIYSTDRPVPEATVERVPPVVLRRIAEEVRYCIGAKAVAFSF